MSGIEYFQIAFYRPFFLFFLSLADMFLPLLNFYQIGNAIFLLERIFSMIVLMLFFSIGTQFAKLSTKKGKSTVEFMCILMSAVLFMFFRFDWLLVNIFPTDLFFEYCQQFRVLWI